MIRIPRTKKDEKGSAIAPQEDWFVKAGNATDKAIEKARDSKVEFDAKVYGAETVRVALTALFEGKCCYCEFPITRSDLNVEHFRPKGRVSESPDHPGYYWLAYEWRNLLPSCAFCNQLRTELEAWPSTKRTKARGKADSFPLEVEAHRAYSPSDQLERERPLLLDPTVDEPSEHVTFDPMGRPVPRSERGEVSVRVYNLETRQLNLARARVIDDVTGLLCMKAKVQKLGSDPAKDEVLREIDQRVERHTDESAPFAGAARAVVANPTVFGL